MKRNEAIERLRNNAEAIKALGATSLYLFGSVARDDAKQASDVDLFIDYDPESRFDAFDLISIKLMLEEKLCTAVDITTRDGLHPRLKSKIEQSATRVF
ncbi:DNA polymerase III subunit beta [Rhizobium sp. AC44/96]|uniref:nucleotidyltransferase family protein n=1 Tax=Rhizobium sp. AC44/96 TaxID=1841654 RepID=UPI00080FBAC2|nr:nucleotidyltransferase domain-containing protein [Rhizobium sp. AC44/96]OCJ17941.1 DNA polymerase III subunit beta [Rhizobium sp. AC44/96]